ncbi:MAG: hypothetical protein ACRC62_19050 [Microcoleus sp.]
MKKEEGRRKKEEGRGGDGEMGRLGELPITNYQLPITNYQLPITISETWKILLTTHRRKYPPICT